MNLKMNPEIGMRVVCDNEYCTIRYIGNVEGTEGLWLGVEWDNPERGRHNGTYNGVKYFETRESTSGSFVREKKVSYGISCADAIRERYHQGEVSSQDCNILKSHVISREVEFVGADKVRKQQSQLQKLRNVCLDNTPVSSAGKENELTHLVPNVSELLLVNTLLSSWDDVARIIVQLPSLRFLDLSSNHLAVPENPEALASSFQHLESLILSKVAYDWDQILICARMWNSLKCLSLSKNQIEKLKAPSEVLFSNLEELDLGCNSIGSWREICKLGHIPKLRILNLMSTGIGSIRFDDVSPLGKTTLFASLTKLNLSKNSITEWRDVAELSKLVSLTELIIIDNPVMLLEKFETVFQCVVAKLEKLAKLNSMEVTPKLRRDSEIDYVKRYYRDWKKEAEPDDSKARNASPEFLSEHPRYLKLIAEYGEPEDSEIQKKSSVLKDQIISIDIYDSSAPEQTPITRKLPSTMTIGKVKALIRRLFRANGNPQLTYKSPKDKEREVELDNDLRELAFYSVSSGDMIYAKW